jgi:hypothetical protein
MKELSLRPYSGRLFLASSAKDYERGHEKLFKRPDVLSCAQSGRFSGGCGKDDLWTYIVYGRRECDLIHELSHVALHVFKRAGIDPRKAGGEPFCYMLSQLVLDAGIGKK